ncbi:MAG: hypothetical protein PHW73_05360 [Atribacterota bacterium]|nr:hypothetical protein [Atribacterota bacterium]
MESIFPEEDNEEEFYTINWEGLQNELAPLQAQGKISNLRYRKDVEGKTGCFIVRFNATDKLELVDRFNLNEYYPEEDEDKKKWFKW